MKLLRWSLGFVCLSTLVWAQSERGNIAGLITDPTGAVVAAAELNVVNRDTNATARAVSNASGEFNVPNLLPGTYRIEITAPGFKRYIQQNVVVAAATTVRTDIQLSLGQVSEQVEVSAAAAVIQTENAKVSTQVQNKLVDELPLIVAGSMRSPFNLVAVAAEARGDGTSASRSAAGRPPPGTPPSTAIPSAPTAPATPPKPRSTPPPSRPSPSSPSTPTASKPNTARRAAAS
jgi:hypothetical protein